MKKFNIFIFIIFLCIIFLRFWKVPDLFVFGIDEEYQANLAWSIYNDFHIRWIGVSLTLGTTGLDGFYLGPAVTYINALLFKLSSADPVILGYFGSFFGVLTSLSIFYVAKQIYNKWVAVIALVWYGFSALMIFFDRRFWNLTPAPFLSIWLYYSLVKAQQNTRWYVLSTALLAASLHSHLILLLYLLPMLYFIVKDWEKITRFTWIGMLTVFTVITSPLIMFEYFKKGQNIYLPFRLIEHMFSGKASDGSTGNMLEGLHTLAEFASQLIYAQPYGSFSFPLWFLFFAVSGLFGVAGVIFHYEKAPHSRLLLFLYTFYTVIIILWPGKVQIYYLHAFFPLFAVALGVVLHKLDWRISGAVLAVFLFFNTRSILTSSQNYTLGANKNLVKKVISFTGDRPFYLDYSYSRVATLWSGFRYLFKVYGKTPVGSSSDNIFGWIYPQELSDAVPVYYVVIDNKNPFSKRKARRVIDTPGYDAYIYMYDEKSTINR